MDSWILDEKTLPKLGFLGQGYYGYVSLVKTPDGMLMAKKTSLHKYSQNLHKEIRILQHFHSKFTIVRPRTSLVYYETKPVNNKVCSIYMEVAPHGSLKDMITKAGGSLPEKVIGYCTGLILEGLNDLHKEGYVHCDVMPKNILIFPSYTKGELCDLRLADFGLSKEPNGPDPVEKDLYVDSRERLAPEALGPRGVITPPADIWALGIMVLFMFGELSFDLSIFKEPTYHGVVEDFMPGPLSRMAWDFVMRCIMVDPARRSTAEELMSHPFVKQDLGVAPFEMLPVPSCLSDGTIQGRFI